MKLRLLVGRSDLFLQQFEANELLKALTRALADYDPRIIE